MNQIVAKTSLSIKIVTVLVIIIILGLGIGSFFNTNLLIPTGLLAVIAVLCYLFAPIGYELSNKKLIVRSRLSKSEFFPIEKCSKLSTPVSFGVRLWGNGGCFAATGIYWNKSYGKFRAYVVSTKLDDLVLLETKETKIVISPKEPKKFAETWDSQKNK